ncbi:hypothetical protein JAAARDRAFT_80893 [Jaapia argillacea MUCL 33604]|uniref:Uncharacterized protein n=1 Tax=Jaapia argillacea MUCL 33604 TaxID=933084 RepID=A0A067PP05_9AGAM|nr:hypothetical protein JAAARDRAFT_80893 [Jaapia argillacea MUCL 33604]
MRGSGTQDDPLFLSLNQIFYSQDNCADRFRDRFEEERRIPGNTLQHDIDMFRRDYPDLHSRFIAVINRYGALRVIQVDERVRTGRETWEEESRWHSLDHRRLYVMNAVLPPQMMVPCIIPDYSRRLEQEVWNKYTTNNNGTYMPRRGHPGDKMGLRVEASAAIAFIILYLFFFSVLIYGYATKRLRVRSRWTVILTYITVHIAALATGLAFSIVGNSGTGILIAYFQLGAEGYLTLILCTYRFLISWQQHNFESHESWLERAYPEGTPCSQKFLDSFAIFGPRRRPMGVIHHFLACANTAFVTGCSMLAGGTHTVLKMHAATPTTKSLQIVGQSVFLAVNLFLLYCITSTIRQSKRERKTTVTHPTLHILLGAWFLLCIRGIYGVLGAVLPEFSYFSPTNYDADGLLDGFAVRDLLLETATEWAACLLLMSTYLTSRDDPGRLPTKQMDEEEKDDDLVKEVKVWVLPAFLNGA